MTNDRANDLGAGGDQCGDGEPHEWSNALVIPAPIDLAAARAICDAATPGPWSHRAQHARTRKDGVRAGTHTDHGAPMLLKFGSIKQDDAAFIAHVRTAYPMALDEIERLREVAADAGSYFAGKHWREIASAALGRPIAEEEAFDVVRDAVRAQLDAWSRVYAKMSGKPFGETYWAADLAASALEWSERMRDLESTNVRLREALRPFASTVCSLRWLGRDQGEAGKMEVSLRDEGASSDWDDLEGAHDTFHPDGCDELACRDAAAMCMACAVAEANSGDDGGRDHTCERTSTMKVTP